MAAPALSDLNSSAISLISAADAAGGGVLVYGRNDEVLWANEGQRLLMPCTDYRDETFPSLFWKVLNAGMVGNKLAINNPSEWLASEIASRRVNQSLDSINTYPWGKMLFSQMSLDNGIIVQTRIDVKRAGIDCLSSSNCVGIGVPLALQILKERKQFQSLLNSLSIAVCLLDRGRVSICSNSSFDELLLEGAHLLRDEEGRVHAADHYDDMVFRQVVESAAAGSVDSMILPLRSANGAVVAAISAGTVSGTAVLVVSRFGEDAASLAESIRQAFGITPAEADTMANIGLGRSVSQIAEDRNGAEKTVYNQIQRIRSNLKRSKFAADDLASIAALVVRIAAITRHPSRN